MSIRTLVVHVGGIGDFLLTCPSIAAMSQDGPVEVAGRVERVRLAVAGGLAFAAHDLDSVEFSTLFSTPSSRLTQFLAQFERVVLWMKDDGVLARRLSEMGIGNVRVFPGLPPVGWTRHASDYYLNCIGMEDQGGRNPVLLIEPASRSEDVILHGGSGGKAKNWPMERFEEVASVLTRMGRRVNWCVGPAEEKLAMPQGASVIQIDSLAGLASVLAATNLYIGNDSGITHLAAATGCPCIAVFGPTDPRVWGPMGERARVIQGKPWPDAGQVVEVAERMLAGNWQDQR